MTPVEVEYLRRYILNQPSFDITKVPGGALEVPEDVPSTYETFSHMPNWYLKSETYFGHRVYDLHGNFFTGRNWLKPLSAVFDNHETAPVGRAGFSDGTDIGSHRITLWSPAIASLFNVSIYEFGRRFFRHDESNVPLSNRAYPIGFTPIFRFMKYKHGGSHNVHHDASYDYGIVTGPYGKYWLRTTHSVVFFFDTLSSSDGGRLIAYPSIPGRGLHDWTEEEAALYKPERKTLILPTASSAIMFPHEMAHEVEPYYGSGQRRIIRCDLAMATKL